MSDVIILLGSKSDYPIARKCSDVLISFGVTHEIRVASAHRSPALVEEIVTCGEATGTKVFITMAGLAAALPGAVAAITTKPVIGVPVNGKVPFDSLLSIVQLPPGIPAACVGVDRGDNAAMLAIEMMAIADVGLTRKLKEYRAAQIVRVQGMDADVRAMSQKCLVDAAKTRGEGYLTQIDAKRQLNLASGGCGSTVPAALSKHSRRVGKVRDVYLGDNETVLIATGRQSAFDRNLASVPYKGQVLNLTSLWWFENTKHIVPNHVVASPHPNVVVCKKCTVFQVEFVMRGYMTGSTSTSMWTHYKNGSRLYCGHKLPDGMVKNVKLPANLLTPTTKDDEHDEPIDAAGVVTSGRMTQEEWDTCAAYAKALFAFGQQVAARRGLILVDTKYEFGKDSEGNIMLIDEVHTPDSSRYWIENSYAERISAGKEPENVDKEFLRLWFKEHCDPYKDAVLPDAPAELVNQLAGKYIFLYEMITGEAFQFDQNATCSDDDEIQKCLAAYYAK